MLSNICGQFQGRWVKGQGHREFEKFDAKNSHIRLYFCLTWKVKFIKERSLQCTDSLSSARSCQLKLFSKFSRRTPFCFSKKRQRLVRVIRLLSDDPLLIVFLIIIFLFLFSNTLFSATAQPIQLKFSGLTQHCNISSRFFHFVNITFLSRVISLFLIFKEQFCGKRPALTK